MSAESIQERTATSVWFTSPRTVELRASKASAPGPGHVRIQSLFSGISHGSELMVYRGEVPSNLSLDATLPSLNGTFSFPVKYGYANVGRVVDVGRDVSGLAEDDLVFAFNPHETLYTVPETVVIKLPETIDPRLGIFVANVETALNVLLDAMPRLGERIVVMGQGVVGLLITQLARKAGASLIITSDLHENRRRLSLAAGADFALDPSGVADRVFALTGGVGADVVIEASGEPRALDDGITIAAQEARVVVASWYGAKRAELALGSDFHRKRLVLKSSQVSSLDPSLSPRWNISRRRRLVLQYLGELSLNSLISHVLPFERAAEAYKLIDEQPGNVMQVALEYSARSHEEES